MTDLIARLEAAEAGAERMFGDDGGRLFCVALNAAHGFAQATNCPPLADVFRWLADKSDELAAEAILRAHSEARV